MRQTYRSVFALFALVLWGLAAPSGGAAQDQETASRALQITDPNIVRYGARTRLTKGTWDYLKLTLRDTFKQWGKQGGTGANLILDPGYNKADHSAGVIRTTPPTFYYGAWDTIDRSDWGGRTCWGWCCGPWDGIYCWSSRDCYRECNISTRSGGSPWVQVRRPGWQNRWNEPAVPSQLRVFGGTNQNAWREHGFFVAGPGKDYNNIQLCSTYYGTGDANAGLDPACGEATQYQYTAYIDYNVRLFIYPNMHQESGPYTTDPVTTGWFPPNRGPYTGLNWWRNAELGYYGDCYNGSYCTGCNSVGCNSPAARRTYRWYNYAPDWSGAYNSATGYDIVNGSYFRQGDDTAVYTNINNMQIHSWNRSSFIPPDCGNEDIYTRQLLANGEPQYFPARVQDCMRPLMYAINEPMTGWKWKQCDPFDTWNADGTFNPANDDNKWIYPGHPDSGGYGSPRRCGAAPCVGPNCFATPRRTTDIYRAGGGWYLLKTDSVSLDATNNKIDISLSGPDVRIEVGAILDVHACWPFRTFVCVNANNKWFNGRLRIQNLIVTASLYLYSIDNNSCTSGVAGSCTGFWKALNDNLNRPDYLAADVKINKVDIVLPTDGSDPFIGDCNNVLSINYLFDTWDLTVCMVMNLIKGTLEGILENAIQGMIGDALGDFVADLPNLSTILGDPIKFNTGLIENGIFLTGSSAGSTGTPPRWPVDVQAGPGNPLVDIQMSMGFKPIAFFRGLGDSCFNGTGICTIDTADVPSSSSVYGIPKLMDRSTSGCSGAVCSLVHGEQEDADQQYDFDDFIKSGSWGGYGYAQRIPELWRGPITPENRPPAWCASPRQLRSSGGSAAQMNALYPQTTWLSFDTTSDRAPAGSGLLTPAARNTIGLWELLPAGTVIKQNQNNPTVKEGAISYDLSLHVHQKTFAQFVQAIVASGMGCVEFGPEDPLTGEASAWKDLLRVDRFAAFIPEANILYPGSYAKVRIRPLTPPRIRTGVGRLSYTPKNFDGTPGSFAPAPINNEPYTLSAAIPDVEIQFLVNTKPGDLNNAAFDVPILTMKYNTVAGFFMKAIRQCFYLDPLYGTPQCNSTLTNVRTVSGYYEFYVDLNTPAVGSAWEASPVDGFSSGRFTKRDFASSPGTAMFEVTQTFCDTSARCDALGLANSIPALLNSAVSLFFISRFSFYNLTLDFLYIGPDGPNDDGVGGGDYLGIYTRFLGNLNVLGLIASIGDLAPAGNLQPKAVLPVKDKGYYVNTALPAFPVQVNSYQRLAGGEVEESYTYRVDEGFWRTPSNEPALRLTDPLTEGVHTLEVRAIEDTPHGSFAALEPTKLTFVVDTLPPEIDILPAAEGRYRQGVPIKMADLQTPGDEIKVSYRWNEAPEWLVLKGDVVPARGLPGGRNVLRLRAEDLAGNVGTAAKIITLDGGGFGCASSRPEMAWVLITLLLLPLVRRRGHRA